MTRSRVRRKRKWALACHEACRHTQSVSEWLGLNDAQKANISDQQLNIKFKHDRCQKLIDGLIKAKATLLQELQTLDDSLDCVRAILTPEQTAKLMIFAEKVSFK